MGTKKLLVNPEPTSDESEKTAEAEALEAILQQEYDKAQRFFKECEDDPILKECMDDPKEKDGVFQLYREIIAEFPEFFLRSKLPDSATTEEKSTESRERFASFREKFEARFIKMMSEQSPELREHIAARARQGLPSESRERGEAVMKFLKVTDTDEPSKPEEKKRDERKS